MGGRFIGTFASPPAPTGLLPPLVALLGFLPLDPAPAPGSKLLCSSASRAVEAAVKDNCENDIATGSEKSIGCGSAERDGRGGKAGRAGRARRFLSVVLRAG